MLKFAEDKTSIEYKLRELIEQSLRSCFREREIGIQEDRVERDKLIVLEHPENPIHGDYSTNIAMKMFSRIRNTQYAIRNTQDLAEKIVKNLPKADFIEKVEVAGPGFINFWLAKEWLASQLEKILKEKEEFGKQTALKGKKILLEHTSPDPIKTLHIGHLRNNFLGMAMSRILKTLGAAVTMDCINNDRGTHVSQAIFGFLAFGQKTKLKAQSSHQVGGQAKLKVTTQRLKIEELKKFRIPDGVIREIGENFKWRELLEEWVKKPEDWLKPEDLGLKSDHFDLRVYAAGTGAIKLVPELKNQVAEILQAWEAEDEQVWKLWRQIIDWSLQGYEETYRRIGSDHDHLWHESDLYKEGKEMVNLGLEKGIFKKSQGAIVTDLSKYNLPDTVIIKSDGTALYITFDINLTKQKKLKFPADFYIWDIGNDQKLYLQQMFTVCEQLGIARREELFHLNFGYVFLKGKGKMSSREGTIVSADDLLDLLVKRAGEIRKAARRSKAQEGASDEKIGLGALKYALLKSNREQDIFFDPEESVSLEGDSGPYLQYTYARCQSVLRKAQSAKRKAQNYSLKLKAFELNAEEKMILRSLYQFPEVVLEAGGDYAPNLICNYLYDLATLYNTFYNKYRILQPEEDTSNSGVAKEHLGGEILRHLRGGGPSTIRCGVKIGDAISLQAFRLSLTSAVAQVLKNGLNLLGIEALEEM